LSSLSTGFVFHSLAKSENGLFAAVELVWINSRCIN